MRARVTLMAVAVAVAVVVAAALAIASFAGGDGDDPTPAATSELAAKTFTAGEVTLRLEPHHLDATGAEFRVTLDTHSEELDMDLVAGARLVVDGNDWPATAWDGDGPSGHHREGALRFDPAGSASGTVQLSLDDFPDAVIAQWTIGG